MAENRPYTFELAAIALEVPAESAGDEGIRDVAARNGVDLDQFDRAVEILKGVAAAGGDIGEWVRNEYILDGRLHGYLPIDASLTDADLTTWKLGQYAEAHYTAAP